ncbi:ComEA family DNA-binding protein [Nocardioides sp.]|uniref:ComEA family DNA-binding protein n=1 Tax=Nocardioides sp. TaxID=35761 RepID=UPI002ED12F35
MTRIRRADHEAALERRLTSLRDEVAAYGAPEPPTRDIEPSEVVPVPVPLALPRPGRHASRRPGRAAGLLPESMRGRIALGPGTLTVVAVVVAVGLGVTAWWIVRTEPSVVAPVEPRPAPALASPATPTTAAAADGAAEGAATPGGSVTVDVAGKVRRPGIAVLDAGARVVDALRAAGGARPGVDLTGLNLARVLVDGEQIVVGLPAASTTAPAAPVGGATPAAPLVDLNTATTVELEGLPEVGPVTAQAIVAWRDQNGGFTAVSELLEVDGIGDATLATIAPFVTV